MYISSTVKWKKETFASDILAYIGMSFHSKTHFSQQKRQPQESHNQILETMFSLSRSDLDMSNTKAELVLVSKILFHDSSKSYLVKPTG